MSGAPTKIAREGWHERDSPELISVNPKAFPLNVKSPLRSGSRPAKYRADLQPGFAGGDLLSAVPAYAMHFDKTALAMNRQAGTVLCHDLADLLSFHLAERAGDAFRALE
jgi:hypothetical protein